jgi:hypothetical protein
MLSVASAAASSEIGELRRQLSAERALVDQERARAQRAADEAQSVSLT